jgi:hypothetical protein
VGERVGRATEAVSDAAQRGRAYAVRAGSSIADAVGENSLLLGALGLTAGVLLGDMLLRTASEDTLIRPATDWAAGAATDAADEVIERGSKAAKAAASAAWEAARK